MVLHPWTARTDLITHDMTKNNTAESTSSPSPVPQLAPPSASSWDKLKTAYLGKTPLKAKALDAYLLCCFMMGILQLAFCIATKGRNYQQFLAGFLSCVGSFVMAGT